MRAFIAIEIPDATKGGMAAVQSRLKGAAVDASWTRPEGIHLTLKFLGETSEELVPQILRALTLALSGTERFRLGGEGVGTFPHPAFARVVWFGVTGAGERLGALQAAVEHAMAGVGFAREGRPYTPHLTLGRIKRIRKRAAWIKGLAAVKAAKLPGFDVTAISLIGSELEPTGARYRELGKVALR